MDGQGERQQRNVSSGEEMRARSNIWDEHKYPICMVLPEQIQHYYQGRSLLIFRPGRDIDGNKIKKELRVSDSRGEQYVAYRLH
jgi:hypothetical protein